MSDQSEAERLYLTQGWTMAAIAQKLNVTSRTIERWAKAGEWAAKKKASKVVSINQSAREEPTARVQRSRGALDDIEIVETAISDISSAMTGAGSEDVRSLGGLATALVKLLEYRRKIQPPTAAELAEQVLAMEISPSEFVAELKQKWLQRA